jgi:DNA-binding MarR family transcriptional regulator
MDFVKNAEITDRIARVLPLVVDRLQRLVHGLGESSGLTRIQLQLLEYLHRNDPSDIGTLKRGLGRAQSSISELVDRLEERGLVARVTCDDRRRSGVTLTASGRNCIRLRDGQQRDSLLQLFSNLDLEGKQALLHHLCEVLAAIGRVRSSHEAAALRNWSGDSPRVLWDSATLQ